MTVSIYSYSEAYCERWDIHKGLVWLLHLHYQLDGVLKTIPVLDKGFKIGWSQGYLRFIIC